MSEPSCPAIVPMCFPDLRWNAHGHVRALLANTNALVYQEDGEQDTLNKLLDALKLNGIEIKNNKPSKWSSEDAQLFLEQMVLNSFEKIGKEFNGKSLMAMNADSFDNAFASAAKNFRQKMGELEEEACAREDEVCLTDSTSSEDSRNDMVEESYDGMYKVIAKTTNYYDQNITKSNVFLVTLQKNGIGSSGCAWTAGSIHDNYDGVTCIWQGVYSSNGSFHFTSLYSNDTKEEYSGRFEKCSGDDGRLYARGKFSKYAWFGYGRESYGMLDMFMYKLSSEEAKEVKKDMQSLALGDSSAVSLEAIMQHIGPNLSWSEFHHSADSFPYPSLDERGFCLTPDYNATVNLGAPIAVQFQLRDGYTSEDNCVISIIHKGSEKPNYDTFFYANQYTVPRGCVFPINVVPTVPGYYEVALFNASGQKIAYNPIRITK